MRFGIFRRRFGMNLHPIGFHQKKDRRTKRLIIHQKYQQVLFLLFFRLSAAKLANFHSDLKHPYTPKNPYTETRKTPVPRLLSNLLHLFLRNLPFSACLAESDAV